MRCRGCRRLRWWLEGGCVCAVCVYVLPYYLLAHDGSVEVVHELLPLASGWLDLGEADHRN